MSAELSASHSSMELLPQPFVWIKIPMGNVTIEDNQYPVDAFEMAKYPTTVAQYALFVDDGGYEKKQYWSAAGWEACQGGFGWNAKASAWQPTGEAWIAPRYWQDPKWHKDDHPVVGVSWYEAMAFCRWLSEKTDENIVLPTEQQWQFAAQEYTKYLYPWGNTLDETRCNFNHTGITPITNKYFYDSLSTSPVTAYPQAASPFGVMDMSGNVQEWTVGIVDEIELTKMTVLRGGSWADIESSERLTVNYRDWCLVGSMGDDIGFRIACT